MKLTFWGAAQTVTGSMHHLTVQDRQYLLDCGTYQGRRQEARERNPSLPFAASGIDAVLLSHAHIDHSENLPTLVKNGFAGPIYTPPATADLCEPMLLDSAHIQDRKSTRLNSSHPSISYAVFCLKKKKDNAHLNRAWTSPNSHVASANCGAYVGPDGH